MSEPVLSADALLGGRVRIRQPAVGFRVAVDSVLLAAAVPAQPGCHVLDAGAGVGGAALCLAARVHDCRVTGIERDPELARIARENVALNGLEARVSMIAGDILAPPAELESGIYDHVMVNPPHLEAGTARPSPDPARAAANIEGEARLGDWVAFALRMVRPDGSVTFVHRADRLDRLLAAIEGMGDAGEVTTFPLWPRRGEAAKRVLVRARKGARAPARLAFGLVLHDDDDSFTTAADAVLREGKGLVL